MRDAAKGDADPTGVGSQPPCPSFPSIVNSSGQLGEFGIGGDLDAGGMS